MNGADRPWKGISESFYKAYFEPGSHQKTFQLDIHIYTCLLILYN